MARTPHRFGGGGGGGGVTLAGAGQIWRGPTYHRSNVATGSAQLGYQVASTIYDVFTPYTAGSIIAMAGHLSDDGSNTGTIDITIDVNGTGGATLQLSGTRTSGISGSATFSQGTHSYAADDEITCDYATTSWTGNGSELMVQLWCQND